MLISKFDTADIEEKITDLECQYKIVLPDQYKQFLYKYNGGETPETSFRLARVSSDVCGFFGLGVSNLYYQFEHYFDDDEISVFVSEGIFCIYRAELATCTGKTCHLAGEFPPPRRRGLPVQKRDHIL